MSPAERLKLDDKGRAKAVKWLTEAIYFEARGEPVRGQIAVAGDIRAVLERARAVAGHLVKVEIEVDTLEQLAEVLAIGLADAVLLDNMDHATLRKAVAMTAGRLTLEASGGVTLDSTAEIAKTGVDYASSGFITHSAPNLDVALDIEI